MNQFIDRAIHPRCLARERARKDYLIILMEILIIFVLLTLFWPSPWLLLLAPVIGVILVTHPGCLLFHYGRNHTHNPRGPVR